MPEIPIDIPLSKTARWAGLLTLIFILAGAGAAVASPVIIEADVIITDVKIYASPTAAPMPSGTVWIEDGLIVRVSPVLDVALDQEARIIRGEGRPLVAGFWNSHVHFTPPSWADPRTMSDEQVAARLVEMLTRFGFTSVVDTGADPSWIEALIQKIDGGLPGPRILQAAGSFVGKDASPAYLDFKLPELATAAQATAVTKDVLRAGPEGIKIFTGSFVGPGKALHMTPDVVEAITRTAHAADTWVIAHPQSKLGLELAVAGGVDILAHTAPDAGKLSEALITQMVDHEMALIPTLQLWRFELSRGGAPPQVVERFQKAGVEQLKNVAAAGGEILFGTDVGYMTDFNPSEEYRKMAEAGLDFRAILKSLTTAPARRFLGPSGAPGTITEGEPADLVVLAVDPATDVEAFAGVDLALRQGQVIYTSEPEAGEPRR